MRTAVGFLLVWALLFAAIHYGRQLGLAHAPKTYGIVTDAHGKRCPYNQLHEDDEMELVCPGR